jgi:hypothetical protein
MKPAQNSEFEITEAMVDAGLEAYFANGSHDEMSFLTPREMVTQILQAAISTATVPEAHSPYQ